LIRRRNENIHAAVRGPLLPFATRGTDVPQGFASETAALNMSLQDNTSPPDTRWLYTSLRACRGADLPADIVARLALAAIAIPEQMATARLGGFAPQIGFFAFIAGSVGFAMWGANRFLSCGADSTITPIFAGGLALLAASGSPDYQALAMALALMVGVMLIAGGVFRLDGIANLLSR
jgi:MFS superfamily sulfate permease-like transporter